MAWDARTRVEDDDESCKLLNSYSMELLLAHGWGLGATVGKLVQVTSRHRCGSGLDTIVILRMNETPRGLDEISHVDG